MYRKESQTGTGELNRMVARMRSHRVTSPFRRDVSSGSGIRQGGVFLPSYSSSIGNPSIMDSTNKADINNEIINSQKRQQLERQKVIARLINSYN